MFMALNLLFRSLRSLARSRKNREVKPKNRLYLEYLEDRTMPSVTVGVSVDGMNTTNSSCNCQPPDSTGAVGPNHFVHMVNTAIEIFNKNGTVAVAPQSTM